MDDNESEFTLTSPPPSPPHAAVTIPDFESPTGAARLAANAFGTGDDFNFVEDSVLKPPENLVKTISLEGLATKLAYIETAALNVGHLVPIIRTSTNEWSDARIISLYEVVAAYPAKMVQIMGSKLAPYSIGISTITHLFALNNLGIITATEQRAAHAIGGRTTFIAAMDCRVAPSHYPYIQKRQRAMEFESSEDPPQLLRTCYASLKDRAATRVLMALTLYNDSVFRGIMAGQFQINSAAVANQIKDRMPIDYCRVIMLQETNIPALVQFRYHQGSEKPGYINIRQLREAGETELTKLGTSQNIHNRVDMFFRIIAYINDPTGRSEEAVFWRRLPDPFLSLLREQTDGMQMWDRTFLLDITERAFGKMATLLTSVNDETTTAPELKERLRSIWASITVERYNLTHMQIQLRKATEPAAGERFRNDRPPRPAGRDRIPHYLPRNVVTDVASNPAGTPAAAIPAGSARDQTANPRAGPPVCVSDAAHQLLNDAVCRKHAAGQCKFQHISDLKSVPKGELLAQFEKALSARNPALLARLRASLA